MNIRLIFLAPQQRFGSEIPGSLVSEYTETLRLAIGIRNRLRMGTDISAQVVPESESEPTFQLK